MVATEPSPPPLVELQTEASPAASSPPDASASEAPVPEVDSHPPANPFLDPIAALSAAPSPPPASVSPAPGTASTTRAAGQESNIVSLDRQLANMLKLETHDLEIKDQVLVVTDKAKRKRDRTSCSFSLSSYIRSIPLYNVLWASVSDGNHHLVIDYAEDDSKTSVCAAKLTLPLEPAGPDRPTAVEASAWADLLRDRAYGDVPQRRRAYVLVNPGAGPGGALKKWEQQVRPIMDAARMQLTVVTTAYSGEAVDLCEALDIDQYDIVIPCSGDGLPHEVFNGLGKRPDARRALNRIAVAHIPCGSGNAMSCNLYGTHRASLAALAIVKGVVAPLDLVSITQGDRRILSFLSQAVGIVAEADLATEHLRWMGGARFHWGFFARLLTRKVYPCDLAVKVAIEHKDGIRRHYSRHQGHGPRDGGENYNDGDDDEQQQRLRAKLEPSVTSSDAGTSEAGEGTAVAASSSAVGVGGGDNSGAEGEDNDDDGDDRVGLPPLRYGTVNDEVPADWETIPEDKMGNFYCGNMAYMAPDANFFSAALMNDGLMDLVTVDGDISPAKSLAMLLSVEDNRFFDNPLVRYRKIAGFRLTPKNQKDGYISIDGERIPFAPFQAEIHKGLGRVIAKRTTYEAPGPVNWEKVSAAERFMA